MEDADSDEPEKKRPHLGSESYAMARHPSSSPPDNKTVDAAVLQCQNQKLVQLLDGQKNVLHDLEAKIKELKDKQATYDSILINVNQLWNQLAEDLVLLRVRAGADQSALQGLDQLVHSRGSIPSCKAEETFLCRLLETDSIQSNGNDGSLKFVRGALSMRVSATKELMNLLEETISGQRTKTESIAQALRGKASAEDAIIQISKAENLMKEEAACLQGVIDVLHLKHKDYSDRIQSYINSHSVDQSEVKLLAGELEECMAQLEDSRRKLVSMKTQEGMASRVHTPSVGGANGNLSPEKPADRTIRLRELKDSIEETKILAADRLSELQDAQEDDRNLSKQLQGLQDELKDEKYVKSSRLYSLLNDQLQHWNAQLERYRGLADSLQADRSSIMCKEKELSTKAESIDTARNAIKDAESKIEELQLQMKNCVIEKNELEIKMEETLQNSGRKDIKDEFHVMASALSKELGMMEAQLTRWKETAHEALSLREESKSLKALLDKKASEQKSLADKCGEQTSHIKSLKALIEKKQKEKLEMQILLDMIGQQIYDNRDIVEIKDSEQRARLQAEHLRNALEEHGLELRIRAANEAESVCQERLRRAEAEIAELRAKSDAYDRDVLELKEAVKMKDVEAEAYISEIETIGQAYEDMQTQHQHLLQQVTDRDDYNLKLVSESVKTKQAQSLLLSEKQALEIQLQQVNRTLDSTKFRINDYEEQMKACIREVVNSTQEDKHLAVSLETAKWELAEAEKETRWLKSAVSSSEKEYEQIQRKMEETRTVLENERSERNKLDEELVELNRQVAEMSSENGEAAIQKLQDEIKNCKAILKCGVCFDRPKEVVIVKCFHLFCHPCIQRNLEIRHRKCPGCGTAFGQSDVRFVKI